MTEREHPVLPRAAASAAVFRGRSVLLVQRGNNRLRGLWSLPGGHVEPGETARRAALREVVEETGIVADLFGLADVHDAIVRDAAGGLLAHYLIAVYCGRWLANEPVAGGDALAACFVSPDDLGRFELTEGIERVIAGAATMLANDVPRWRRPAQPR